MTLMGLPPLPSSVMVKSDVSSSVVEGGGPLGSVIGQLKSAVATTRGLILGLGAVAIIFSLAAPGPNETKRRAIGFVGLASIAGHLAAGQYDWFSRYEIYAYVLTLLVLVYLYGPKISGRQYRAWVRFAGFLCLLAWLSTPYLNRAIITPAGAENIYLQQYQMHRFVTEFFPRPMAANDIGYVTYGNPNYVLDLWGLGSEEARRRRQKPDFGPQDLRDLVAMQRVDFAMIYDDWLGPAVPGEWCRIAELRTPQVTAASGEVAIYLIDHASEVELREALSAFAETLPERDRLLVSDCPAV